MRQLAGPLAIQDHIERGAILHRAAGIEKLGLAVDFDPRQIARDPLHPDERRIADQAEQIGGGETRNRGRAGSGDGHIQPILWYHLFVGRQWGIGLSLP